MGRQSIDHVSASHNWTLIGVLSVYGNWSIILSQFVGRDTFDSDWKIVGCVWVCKKYAKVVLCSGEVDDE